MAGTLFFSSGTGFSGSYAGTGIFDALQLDTTNHDLTLARLAAASLRLGAAPSASPNFYTLTIGESARGGTDTDTAGGNAVIQTGAGTGNASVTSITLKTSTVAASGSTAQTLATRLTITSAAITATVPYLAPDGTQALPGIAFASAPGTGIGRGDAPNLSLCVGGTAFWEVDSSGAFVATTNNAYDFGVAGFAPRTLRLGTNLLIAGATVGTSGVGVVVIGTGTEPSTSPADRVQLYSVDISAGNASLGLRTETAVATDAALVSTHSLTIRINGANYKVMLVSA